ncbi:hypothetical protein [Paenibacillus cremeus]|uniref:Uncharacterized protein n=1 Tax=Paenibacillus cremeus TaxID=2163881 RepID=A0A559K9E5_9BACL|nr:hypothetical protein [Paenibacillus cremeus]TVY08761.1 hypothetical protein FPZ49_17060 [Paenibacillus cremeus]
MSKKLEGNGLWESSRMMLPQHKEQSMSSHQGAPSLNQEPPSRKELEMIRDSILLPMALRMVEKISVDVERSSQTLKLMYAAATKILAITIREDVKKTKKALLERDIRVFDEAKDDAALHYRYVCRGREDRLIMTKEFMKAGISVKIGHYVQGLVTLLQEAATKPK